MPAEAWAGVRVGACFGLPARLVPGVIRAAGSGFGKQLKPEQQDQARRLFGVLVWAGVVWAAGWVLLPV